MGVAVKAFESPSNTAMKGSGRIEYTIPEDRAVLLSLLGYGIIVLPFRVFIS